VDHRRANVVDQLLLDQQLRVPDTVKDFTDRERRCRVLSDEPEAFRIVGDHGVLEPKQPKWFEVLSKPRRFDWGQAVVNIVQQMSVRSERVARGAE
jgi:hypothetical protein